MRTAVFVTPEILFVPQSESSTTKPSIFRLAEQTAAAFRRLKQNGFIIIGVGNPQLFNGFATKSSYSHFLTSSALDDIILPRSEQGIGESFIDAASRWLLNLDGSFLLGGSEADHEEASITGCTPIGLKIAQRVSGESAGLSQAVERILQLSSAAEPELA